MYKVLFLLLILLTGCGLPTTVSIDKPRKVSDDSLPGSVLAFRTPSDNSLIQGYALYYKVYYSETDFNDEEDDSRYFEESTYLNDNAEMQPGPVIPRQRGYVRIGDADGNQTTYPGFLVSDPVSASSLIYLVFDPGQDRGDFFDDSSDPPVVSLSHPVLLPVNTITRGIIDPTSADNSLLSFVGDWDFDSGNSVDYYHDADLKRRYNLPDSFSVEVITNSMASGNAFFDDQPVSSDLIIGIVAHSVGLDTSNLQVLYSKPEFIGSVRYTALTDANRTTR